MYIFISLESEPGMSLAVKSAFLLYAICIIIPLMSWPMHFVSADQLSGEITQWESDQWRMKQMLIRHVYAVCSLNVFHDWCP